MCSRGSLRSLILVLPALVLPSLAEATPILVIDDFELGSTNITVNADEPSKTDLDAGLAGVLGGERHVELLYGDGPEDLKARINSRTYTGYLSLSQDSATWGAVTLTYGHSADLNANLSAGGADRFSLLLGAADVSGDIEITVTTTGLGSSMATIATGVFSSDTNLDVLFSAFSPAGATGANFSNVDTIRVRIKGSASGDYILKNIAIVAIPEPSSLGVILLGAVVLALRFRRPGLAAPDMV